MFMDDLTEEELRRIQASNSAAPVAGGSFGDDPRFAAALANGRQAMAAPFADAASVIGSRLAGGLGGLAAEGGDAPFTSMPPPPPGPYQHYSATANPMSAPAIEAQSNRQYTPMTVPNDPPGFFGGLGASLGGMPQERQPLWSNVSGPAAPGQRESDWRNDGGVMINDGFGAMPSTANGPGAGYTSQGMDGSVKPIAFSTDADYGARLSTDPYTNPAIQDLIRKQNMAKELQSIGFANDMAKLDRTIGYKEEQSREAQQQKALRSAFDPMLSQTAKAAEIDKTNLTEEQKNRIKMEAATSRFDPKLKQNMPIGHTDTKTGAVDMQELLQRIPSGIPTDQVKSFLDEGRGVPRDVLAERIKLITQRIGASSSGDRNLPSNLKKEYDNLVRLGLMGEVKPPDRGPMFNFGMSGFSMGP